MERNTFNSLFFIKRKQLLRNGEAPIYLRITVMGERAEMSTNQSVNPNLWDSKKGLGAGRSTSAYELNNELEKLRLRISKFKGQLEEKDLPVTAQAIIDLLQGKTKENAGIVELFQEHNDKCRQLINKDFAPATVTRYETTLKHLKGFLLHEYKTTDKPIKSIDHGFITEFEHWLKTKKTPCGHNSTVKYIRNFRKIIRIALNNEWIQKDPFRNIKYSYEETKPDYLSYEELILIIKKIFSIERLQQVKDIFVFCCFTGLCYSDVKRLTKKNIEVDNTGKKWIHSQRKKTKKEYIRTIPDIALSILEKYENDPMCIINNRLLPVLSNQKMNAYLKEIADICGIQKQISTHTARHTCATTVELANGVPMEVISSDLGHSNTIITGHYAKVGNNEKIKYLDIINNVYRSSLLEKDEDVSDFPNNQAN